jgi:hypothetical protein
LLVCIIASPPVVLQAPVLKMFISFCSTPSLLYVDTQTVRSVAESPAYRCQRSSLSPRLHSSEPATSRWRVLCGYSTSACSGIHLLRARPRYRRQGQQLLTLTQSQRYYAISYILAACTNPMLYTTLLYTACIIWYYMIIIVVIIIIVIIWY